jgi:hypothetical protein
MGNFLGKKWQWDVVGKDNPEVGKFQLRWDFWQWWDGDAVESGGG